LAKITNVGSRRFNTRHVRLLQGESKTIDAGLAVSLIGLDGAKVEFEAADDLSGINEYRLLKAAKFAGLHVSSKQEAISALKPKPKSVVKKTTKHLKSVVSKAKEAVLPVEETTEE
tara:strand:+ start:362 stop:709 length:348 start_codon:yes stop_codon:yes gene_type:complete